jgi:hypothetical protein
MIEGVSRLQEVGASRLRMGLWAAAGVLLLGGVALFAAAPDSEESAALGSAAALRSVATQRIEPAQVRAVAELSGVVDARRSVRLFA